jgi:hypothetical protein
MLESTLREVGQMANPVTLVAVNILIPFFLGYDDIIPVLVFGDEPTLVWL